MSFCTAAENSDSSGYIRRASPTRTTAIPLACSVVIFIRLVPLHRIAGGAAPARFDRLVLLQSLELVRQLDASAVDARLDGPLRQPEAIRDFLVRQLLQIAEHDGRAERHRQRL